MSSFVPVNYTTHVPQAVSGVVHGNEHQHMAPVITPLARPLGTRRAGLARLGFAGVR